MMEASLTCAVCLGLFEEPVTLPLCSHNFCWRCVQGCSSSPPSLPQQLCCPLCRKVSSVPGGATRLPVNTTLAEVVKLLRSAPCKEKEDLVVGAGPCLLHSGRQLLLYCRMCHKGVCGQCVSEHHQGPFHSINLMDITYQEEKLTFFSILKKLREVGEKLSNEISEDPNDIEAVLQIETEIITSKFDEISKILDLKRKQLLEYISNQRSRKMKEHQLWKEMKTVDKKTVVNLLLECEKIVDECDPQSFLKVACDLNKRMNTKIELLHVSSTSVAAQQFKPSEIDINPALDAISSLKLTEDHFRDPFSKKQDSNKKFTFKTSTKRWKENIDVSEKFCELRLKYYDSHRQVTHDVTVDSVPENKRELMSNPGIFDKMPNLVIARERRKGRPKLTRQRCFDNSCHLSSSLTSVSKISTNIIQTNQKVDELFASHRDSAQEPHLENGFVFGVKEAKCIADTPDQASSDRLSNQMPNRDTPFMFTSNSIDVSLTTDEDHQSNTKEAPMNVSVHPYALGDKSTTHHNESIVPGHCGRLFSGSASSPTTVSIALSDLDNTKTTPAVTKSNFPFSFGGDSKNSFLPFNANKPGNPSFSFTVAQPLSQLQESAKVKMRSEKISLFENTYGGFKFSSLKGLALDSESPNSKAPTLLKGVAEMDADVKKNSAPSTPGKNTSSFHSSSCATKPKSTSGFSFGYTSKDNSVNVPVTLRLSTNVFQSSKREEGKETERLSSVALSNDETSLPVHSEFDAGLESNSLFPLSNNISKRSPPPGASFIPMFGTVQSTFTRESSLFPSHPVVTTLAPQTKETIEGTGALSQKSKLCSIIENTIRSQNAFDSIIQIQDKDVPQSAGLSELLRISPKKKSCPLVPLKEDSDEDEGNKGTSSSDSSSTSEESSQVENKLEEDSHSVDDKP
ncbi:uncharacterized protein LOC144819045 isoform X2 [Lissotriton helveticus]